MKYLILIAFVSFCSIKSNAQGCVAIRSNGNSCTMTGLHQEEKAKWSLSLDHRYFKSFRHFSAKEEQKERVERGTEVINYANAFTAGLTNHINDRWSLALYVPIISNGRSSLYEHTGRSRHNTRSFGLGDLRVAAYRWMLDTEKSKKGNIQLGFGIKLPTGDYRYQDYFQRTDSTRVLGPVDQSIQLGDGGTGLTLELNTFYHLSRSFSVYGNAFYLANPREQNGVSTARGGTPSAANIAYGSDVMSVPDQYMFRVGGTYVVRQFSFSAGIRMECLPVYDMFGGSNGFRRPGYVVAAEPVVAYKAKKTQWYLSVPYAVERARTQSVPDKKRTTKTGTPFTGDAAFADYSVNLGVAFQLK